LKCWSGEINVGSNRVSSSVIKSAALEKDFDMCYLYYLVNSDIIEMKDVFKNCVNLPKS